MLKFIRGKSQQPSAERQKLQKELFAFRKTVQHGFPNKPSSLAWDPELRLAAIATSSGAIKVFGKPGVEFYGHLPSCEHSVMKLGFIPNQGYLILLLDDSSLHLWEINDAALVEINSFTMEGRLKRLSTFTVESTKENIILGTEGGNVYFLNIAAFKTCENIDCGSSIIYQDIVMQNVPEKYKINPGAVEIVEEQPNNREVLLIGYQRGLVVLWNKATCVALQTYVNSQQLESLCWHPTGHKFVTVHNDGSMVVWGSDKCDSPLEEPISFYGPFPCKAINKILWRKATDLEHDNLVIFCGGMPRATYGDHHCLTVQRGLKKLICFDFTSKIIDFFTIESASDRKTPEALIVLLEEELVAIDLKSDDWKVIELPYLYSLHSSSITFTNFVSNVDEKLWNDLTELGRTQREGHFSTAEWPINGGVVAAQAPNPARKSLLITGHEDGSVRFWDAGSCCLFPLYWFKTSTIFSSEDDFYEEDQGNVTTDDEGEGWPPFRKVGCFDPYSDDPRLAIKKVCLCPISGYLAIAGAGGQVIICEVRREPVTDKNVKVHVLNLVSDRDSFAWKGHERLFVKGSTKQDPNTAKFSVDCGYQTSAIIQVYPPASVTALVLQAEWGLVAIGTAHGVMLFDYVREAPVFVKCTLTSNESGVNEPPISRTKSFKKSLRESFRRLRKGRSSRHPDRRSSGTSNAAKSPPISPNAPEPRRRIIGNDSQSPGSATAGSSIDARPVERAVEARPADDPLGSMIRCLYFAAHSYIANLHNPIPALWAGTNSGTVYIFTINIPSATKRKEEKITAQLGKEIQLKHRAPVIGICIIDGSNRPLPESFEVERKLCKPVDYSSPHHVIIGSEEQFKIFSLPHLRATGKLKLTATEGARVRRMNLALFSTAHHLEYCLLCLTNLGECLVLSVPDLRKQIMAAVIRREDINGISTLTFSRYGEGLYLQSSSEIQRFSLSTSRITKPHCTLNLPVKPIRLNAPSISSHSEEPSSASLSSPSIAGHCTITEEIEEPEAVAEAKTAINVKKSEHVANTSQNRMSSVSDDEGFHDVSAITIDSVKEHFTNLSTNSTNETTTTTTQVVHKILKEEVTIKTSSVNNNTINETPPSVSSATIPANETPMPKHTTTSV